MGFGSSAQGGTGRWGTGLDGRLREHFPGANGRWDQRCPYEDQGERRKAHAYNESVVAEPVSEDRQPGHDRRQVCRDRGDGDHRDAVADLEAASGGEEREHRRRDDDDTPGTEDPGRPTVEVPRERLYRHV